MFQSEKQIFKRKYLGTVFHASKKPHSIERIKSVEVEKECYKEDFSERPAAKILSPHAHSKNSLRVLTQGPHEIVPKVGSVESVRLLPRNQEDKRQM